MTRGLSNDDWGSDEWPEPDFDDDHITDAYDADFDGGLLPASIGDVYDDESTAPSLPVILVSALFGVAGAVLGLYVSYDVFDLGIELSAGVATLSMLFCLGTTGAVMSGLTAARGAPVNILFSCGLVLVCVLFFVSCALCGAVSASLLIGI